MPNTYPEKSNKFLKIFFSLNEEERSEFFEFCKLKFIGSGRDYAKIVNNFINNNNNSSPRSSWNRLSELTRIIEDYLLLKYLQKNKEDRNTQLLEIYNLRSLNDIVESQFNFASKIIEKQKFNERTYYNLHRLHMAFSVHQIQNNKYLKFVKHFRKQSEYIIAYFLTDIFSMQTEFNQQKLENIWHDWVANETVLQSLDTGKIIESFKNNIPDMYNHILYSFYLYKAFDDPDKTEYFFKAKELFDKLVLTLNRKYTSMAYQAFINYCINRTNNYDFSFNRVLFEINNEKLSMGFDEDIRLRNYPTNNFRDYVIVGLRLKEYDWVENFITKYGVILPDDYKPDEVNICWAMLNMHKKEYDDALKVLEKTKRKNYLHYIDTSEMKLRIFYEKNDFINAYDELTRAEKYLASSEAIPKQRRTSYEKFFNAYKKLIRLKENFSQDRLAKTELFLQKQTNFLRKAWIEEKIKELVNNA